MHKRQLWVVVYFLSSRAILCTFSWRFFNVYNHVIQQPCFNFLYMSWNALWWCNRVCLRLYNLNALDHTLFAYCFDVHFVVSHLFKIRSRTCLFTIVHWFLWDLANLRVIPWIIIDQWLLKRIRFRHLNRHPYVDTSACTVFCRVIVGRLLLSVLFLDDFEII